MTAPVIGILPSDTIADAARVMLANKISGLPVIATDGTLAGVVSEGDFLRRGEIGTDRKRSAWLKFFVSSGKAADEYVHARGRRVDEVMSPTAVTISRTAPLEDAVAAMARHDIKRLPVVEGGRVVGIVSRSDLMRALLAVWEASPALRRDDTIIRNDILAEFATQTWAGNRLFRVTVDHGAVELSGTILDERERRAACVVAENVAGVTSVSDQLTWIEPITGTVIDPISASR